MNRNEINATNLQRTVFCNKSNRYNIIVTCVNYGYAKLNHLFFDRTSSNFINLITNSYS